MTWIDGWTRSPESAEDDALRPELRRVQIVEVRLLDDHLERLEKAVTSVVFFNADNVDASPNKIGFDEVRRDVKVNAADVGLDRQIGATPRHRAAARLLPNNSISVSFEIRFHLLLRRLRLSWITF